MSAAKDQNFTNTLTCVLNSDGKTIVSVKVNASHRMKINNGVSGSDNGPANALKDSNDVPTLLAVSSVDGVTPVVVYADSSGNLLTKSS
jgi:hypothetical protein